MPRKIRLEMDALAVDSFDTGGEAKENGTVHGLDAVSAPNPCIPQTVIQTCARKQTQYASCVAYCECTDAIRACIA